MHRGHKYQVKIQKQNIAGHPVGMSPDVLLECPRTSFRDVLRVNVTERVWHSPLPPSFILNAVKAIFFAGFVIFLILPPFGPSTITAVGWPRAFAPTYVAPTVLFARQPEFGD